MGKNLLRNLLQLVLPAQVTRAIGDNLVGMSLKELTLCDEVELILDLSNHSYFKINLGSKNLLKLSASLVDIYPGELFVLRFTQPPGVNRTVVFDSNVFNVPSGKTVTDTLGGHDVWLGLYNGDTIDIAPFITDPLVDLVKTTTTTTSTTTI